MTDQRRLDLALLSPRILSLLRIMVGLIYLSHGTAKLFGFPDGAQPGIQASMTPFWFLGIVDCMGGLAIALGLFTRPVAFLLSGEMAVAYFLLHAPRSFFPQLNSGELTIMLCFTLLYIAAAGPGPWSLDARRAPDSRIQGRP